MTPSHASTTREGVGKRGSGPTVAAYDARKSDTAIVPENETNNGEAGRPHGATAEL